MCYYLNVQFQGQRVNLFNSALHVWRQIRSTSGALFDCIYSFWYNSPTLLLTGATDEMELTFHLNRGIRPSAGEFLTVYTAFGTLYKSAAVSVHCTKSCIFSQKLLLRMGKFVARNM